MKGSFEQHWNTQRIFETKLTEKDQVIHDLLAENTRLKIQLKEAQNTIKKLKEKK